MIGSNSGRLVKFVSVGLIWGLSYPLVAVALQGLAPGQIALARMGLGLLVLGGAVGTRRLPLPRHRSTWAHLAVSSALGMVAPFLLIGFGEQYTGAATAGALIATLPLITLALVAVLLPAERPDRRTAGIFVIAFIGVVLVIAPWRTEAGELLGALAVLGAATAYALETVYIRRFLVPRGLPALVMAGGQLATGLAIQSALIPATGWPAVSLTGPVIVAVAVLGIVGTGVAYLLFNQLIAEAGAAKAASVNYLVPVVSTAGAVALLGEVPTWHLIVGTALVLIALAIEETRPSAHPARPDLPGGQRWSRTRSRSKTRGEPSRTVSTCPS